MAYQALLDLVPSSFSFFTTLCHTGIPVVLWTCQNHLLLRTFAQVLPFFLNLSSDVWFGQFIQVSPWKGLLWLPYLEYQVVLTATWWYIVFFFECFLSSLSNYKFLVVRGFICQVQDFYAQSGRVLGALKVFTMCLLSGWRSEFSCLQSSDYWYLDLTSY